MSCCSCLLVVQVEQLPTRRVRPRPARREGAKATYAGLLGYHVAGRGGCGVSHPRGGPQALERPSPSGGFPAASRAPVRASLPPTGHVRRPLPLLRRRRCVRRRRRAVVGKRIFSPRSSSTCCFDGDLASASSRRILHTFQALSDLASQRRLLGVAHLFRLLRHRRRAVPAQRPLRTAPAANSSSCCCWIAAVFAPLAAPPRPTADNSERRRAALWGSASRLPASSARARRRRPPPPRPPRPIARRRISSAARRLRLNGVRHPHLPPPPTARARWRGVGERPTIVDVCLLRISARRRRRLLAPVPPQPRRRRPPRDLMSLLRSRISAQHRVHIAVRPFSSPQRRNAVGASEAPASRRGRRRRRRRRRVGGGASVGVTLPPDAGTRWDAPAESSAGGECAQPRLAHEDDAATASRRAATSRAATAASSGSEVTAARLGGARCASSQGLADSAPAAFSSFCAAPALLVGSSSAAASSSQRALCRSRRLRCAAHRVQRATLHGEMGFAAPRSTSLRALS